MTQRQIDLWLTPEAEADLMKAQCLKEKVYPPDIARMVLWLAVGRQPAGDGAELRGRRGPDVSAAAIPGQVGRRVAADFRHMLPPTLYFFIAFNLIVFTTNLLVHDYWFKLSSFLLATTTALIVGKAVLVANKHQADRPLSRRAADPAHPLQDALLHPGRAGGAPAGALHPPRHRRRRFQRGVRRGRARLLLAALRGRSRSGSSPAS